MIIGFDARYAEGDLVGVGKYVQNLVLGISQKNKCILFYSQEPKNKIPGSITVILPSKNSLVFEQILLPFAFKKYKIDLYHATGNMGVPIFSNVRSILTVHDLIPLEFKNYFGRSKFPIISKYLYLFKLYTSCMKANKIVSVSNYTKKQLTKIGVNPDKIDVIYSGVNKFPKTNKRFIFGDYILNNGGIDIRKNLDRLIIAFKIVRKTFPKLKLVITGNKNDLSFKNEDGIIFTDYVDNVKMASLLRYARCLCYSSLLEGFGFPVLEAFSFGIPVVSSNTSSIPEIAGNSALLVNPKNEKEIADAILSILKDNRLANNLGKLGLSRVKEFTWQKAANEYLNLYNHI